LKTTFISGFSQEQVRHEVSYFKPCASKYQTQQLVLGDEDDEIEDEMKDEEQINTKFPFNVMQERKRRVRIFSEFGA